MLRVEEQWVAWWGGCTSLIMLLINISVKKNKMGRESEQESKMKCEEKMGRAVLGFGLRFGSAAALDASASETACPE